MFGIFEYFISEIFFRSNLMSAAQSPQTEVKQSTPPPTISQFHHFNSIQPEIPSLSYMSRATALEAGKITATSTHFELEQPNCVSSLITMSCRGRAEAFARSLQTKLRNLGTQVRKLDSMSLLF